MRMRLDHALVERKLVATRSRAQDLIRRRLVIVEGRIAAKAGELVDPATRIEVPSEVAGKASRAAAKLEAGLDAFGLSPAGCVALDIGASTGGFTQVLLQRGAAKVYAIDVGRDQLVAELRSDPRIVSLERTDARALSTALVPEPVTAIVADVSFIPLVLALDRPLTLASAGCWLVALVKPQFELGRGAIGKRGVVRNGEGSAHAAESARKLLATRGWRVLGLVPSPLPGKAGNREWLLGALRDA